LWSNASAKGSQIRGLVAQYGLVVPREFVQLRLALPRWLEDQSNGLSASFRRLLQGRREDLAQLDERVKELDREIEGLAQSDPTAKRRQRSAPRFLDRQSRSPR
jgi:threonine synthase